MADDFDLDDLLDDVLQDTVPVNPDSMLDDLADELLGPATSEPDIIALKYPELECLPIELQKQWEVIIDKDEIKMKSRKPKKLSYAYTSKKSELKNTTLEDFFSMMMERAFKDQTKSKQLIDEMIKDKHFMSLFKEELRKKTRFCIDKTDSDIVSGNFPNIKSVLEL